MELQSTNWLSGKPRPTNGIRLELQEESTLQATMKSLWLLLIKWV